MNLVELRENMLWSRDYHREWDDQPDGYVAAGVVQWGRSRRLGLAVLGPCKGYVGVQHVDPRRPGWNIVDRPQARFFVSLFAGGTCVSLRTYPSMSEALVALGGFLVANQEAES